MGQRVPHANSRAPRLATASRSCILFIFILAQGIPATGAFGATRHVDDVTCPATGSGTPVDPYCRIQDAICAAGPGDIILVAPGFYPEAIRMKPGVSVSSQAGPALTTIDASGQPCTDNDFCVKRAGSQCSVVTFATGHTTSTRIEGFTITGGAGLIQTNQVAGGGIFIFSSATIINNVITNNVLSGPRREYNGAGVYVAMGSPVITSNTISGNRAVPGPGTRYLLTYGYGGGIWVGFQSDPIVTQNVIGGNQAGNPNAAYSLGGGGGIVVFPGDTSHPGPTIDRNMIVDNTTDTLGGGVSLPSLTSFVTGATAVVTNNVIAGNRAKKGGGVYTYLNKSETINNTISDNFAFLGGGIYSGQSDLTLPVTITNNIIHGNRLELFGAGGGIYTLDLDPQFEPIIGYNDFWANQGSAIAGDPSAGSQVGVNGNFASDPLFANAPARDFHVSSTSPVVDQGMAIGAPPVDIDNAPRGQDGNGVPNNPVVGDIDVGAYEAAGFCLPAAEICDGLDNNCNTLVDDGFPDTDGDLVADCLDPDDDNDVVLDTGDCAPLDAGSWGSPLEVMNLDLTGAFPTQVVWDMQSIGTATRYEMVSGLLSRLLATVGFTEGFCASAAVAGGMWSDTRPSPPAADGWYYLVRSGNGCGSGSFGSAQADAAGSGDVCQSGVVDADNDGSPSDLDCNESNPVVSPLQAELCDGLDNNCNGVTDDNPTDTDGDMMTDCADPDDDNDGAMDAVDCAPLNAGAYGLPVEVDEVDVTSSGPVTLISWLEQSLGGATVYEVATGELTVSGMLDFRLGDCLSAVGSSPTMDGRGDPAPDSAWYYMVKSRNACGAGTHGTAGRDTHASCP